MPGAPKSHVKGKTIERQAAVSEGSQRKGQANPVDHVIPRHIRPDLVFDLANLRTLCPKHHRIKTVRDMKKYGVAADNRVLNTHQWQTVAALARDRDEGLCQDCLEHDGFAAAWEQFMSR